MEIKLKKLDENCYKDYQRSMRKIVYSFDKKGESNFYGKQIAKQMEFARMTKPEFLDEVAKSEVAFYCLKDSADNNIGITIISCNDNICTIHEFAVFEKYKGLGTDFYELLLNEIRELWPKTKELKCMCPFEGAQIFWKKMGFERRPKGFFQYWRMMPR